MDEQLLKIQKLLDAAEGNLASARNMLRVVVGTTGKTTGNEGTVVTQTPEENIVEGVFNGEEMIVAGGKNYPVPANYASKSKLVEGDGLKLTIAEDGSFIFKQIAPVERKSLVGNLSLDGSTYTVLADGKSYKVLKASVTFYKAEPGDQVTIVVPKDGDALWGALENVVSKESKEFEVEILPAVNAATDTSEVAPAEPSVAKDVQDIDPNIDKALQVAEDLPPIELPETTEDSVPSNEDSKDTKIPAYENIADVVPDPASPKIEFPGESGNENLTDDQLLENLKNNLKNMSTPEFVSPVTVTEAKPASSSSITQSSASSQKPAPNGDEPISELEI